MTNSYSFITSSLFHPVQYGSISMDFFVGTDSTNHEEDKIMKKKLLAGLLSLAMLIGTIRPVLASDDVYVTESEEDTDGSYDETDGVYDEDVVTDEDVTASKPDPEPATIDKSSVSYNTIYAKPVKINKITYELSAEVSYYDVVKYCGRKIKAGLDLEAEVKSPSLDQLAAEILGVDHVDLSGVIEWKFTETKNKKIASKSYFIVKGKVKKSAAKEIGLKGKYLTRFKKGLSKINSAASKKAERMYFTIVETIPKDGVIKPTGPAQPTATPTTTPKATPTPTGKPKATPTPTGKPKATPTTKPTATPTVKPSPGAEPTGTEDPTGGAEPTKIAEPTKTAEPTPNPEKPAIKAVKINKTNFPDDIFRKVISGRDYDKDGNGTLDENEIFYIRNVNCEGMGVKSVQGIEFFPELVGLWCKDNQISHIDISKNVELTGIWCSNNPLTELDMSHNHELLWVYCFDCKLTELDFSQTPKMAFIECNTNPIKELDLSNCHELEHLTCGSCELTELDLSPCPKLAHLDAFQNHLTQLDVTVCPKMKRLDVWNNVINYKTPQEQRLGAIDISRCPELQYYNCAYNDVESLDLSHNPELFKLNCAYNSTLTSLDVSNNPKLEILICECCPIETIDLSNNHYMHFLQAFGNGSMTKLDIGQNPFLMKAYNEGVINDETAHLGKAIHSWTIDYGWDDSTTGGDKGLDSLLFICFDDVVKLSMDTNGYTLPSRDPYPYSDAGISEEGLLTRAEAIQKLYEMAGSPKAGAVKSRFTDIKGHKYSKALNWAESMHMLAGFRYIPDDTFEPDEFVTRQDLMFMLMRYAEYTKGMKRAIDFGRTDDYIDYLDIDFWHWEPMCWAETWLILPGKGGDTKDTQIIDPLGRVTQADLDVVIANFKEANGR